MRLFIALVLPEPLCDDLDDVQSRLKDTRPVPYDNLHLTLSFLGDVSQSDIEPLHEELQSILAPEIELTVSGPEIFGGRHGQALALTADGGTALGQLHDQVRSRTRSAGLNVPRRRFRPHVTLARMPGRADPAKAFQALRGLSIGPYAIQRFALFASNLHPDGAMHDVLADYPLGAQVSWT